MEETLLGLNRVGLAEAWDYIRPPIALSEGQKFRLKLAMGLGRVGGTPRRGRGLSSGAVSVLACDEFCAILDRITARVVARTLRRTLNNQKNVCAIVATSHDDLVEALQPDILIRCDFGAAEIINNLNCSREKEVSTD
jgi:ABC-type ATPase with predicted acetyltransferase domain